MLLNFHDYRAAARKRLPRFLFDYIDRGAEDETGPRRHRRELDALTLMPRMLNAHDTRDISVTLFDRKQQMPLIVAPTALAGLVRQNGEVALARGVERLGIPYCISTQSVTSVEEIRAGAPGAQLWFQLYMWKNRDLSRKLLERVRAVEIDTLVVTADTPLLPNREYNVRNGLNVPLTPNLPLALDLIRHPGWSLSVLLGYLRAGGMPGLGNYPPEFRTSATRPSIAEDIAIDHSLSWDDIAQLRRLWPGRLLVKGLLAVEDARRAADLGADGIVVSTHGARNLDSAPTTARALPAIAEAVGGRITVLADSCVQRGSDVVKYMALGAQAVMLGRAPLWGLAAKGQPGLEHIVTLLAQETDLTLGLMGHRDLSALEAAIIKEDAG